MTPIEPICEAKVIAAHAQILSQGEWLEVVKTWKELGGITEEHAAHLVDLIEGAYMALAAPCGGAAQALADFVSLHCP